MLNHIILWKLKDEITDRAAAKAEAKSRLEALAGRIPGLLSIKVHTEGLASSSADMMLESVFTDADALAGYQTNPLHVEAAAYVRSVVAQRLCLDFEVEA
jgi:hypothetical protein